MARRFYGYGALPAFDVPGGGLAAGLVNNFLDQVPAGSPGGMNSRQLIARARELELMYGDLMKLPQGAEIVAAARGLEVNLAQAWADIVGFANAIDGLLANDPAKKLATLGPRPGDDAGQIAAAIFTSGASLLTKPRNAAQVAWDDALAATQEEMAAHRSKLDAARTKLEKSLANSFGPKLMTYVVSVSSAATRIRALEHAIIEEKTAAATGNRAVLDLAKAKVLVEQEKVLVEQKKVKQAAAKLEGPSPWLIAAVAVPVLGVLAYALTRRKGSVAGYRRRRSRR